MDSPRNGAECAVETAGRNIRVVDDDMVRPRPGLRGLVAPAGMPDMTRARLKELMALAHETVDWLEGKGLKLGEQCLFREIAERIWFTPKGE